MLKTIIQRFLLILFSLSLFSLAAHAAQLDTQGKISLYRSNMPWQLSSDAQSSTSGFEADYQAQYKLNKIWSLQFHPWLRTDYSQKNSSDISQFETPELSIQWKKSSRSLKIGYSSPQWEGTDIVNPMDLLSVKNWKDPLHPQSRGMAGLFYSEQKNSLSWDLIYIPQQSKTILMNSQSPWLPRQLNLPLNTDEYKVILPDSPQYQILDDVVLNNANKDNAALRLQYHGDSWDLSLAGAETVNSSPTIILDGNLIQTTPKIIQLNSPIKLQPLYYKARMASFALVKTFNTFIVRASAQHVQPLGDDSRIPSWSELGVLGLETTLNWGSQSIILLAQTTTTRKPTNTSLSLLSSALEKSWMLGFRWPFRETWTWSSAYFQEQVNNSNYFRSEIAHSFNDRWSVKAFTDLFSGSSDSILGTFDRNDQFTAQLEYSF